MTSSSAPTQLPDARLVVTGHTPDGSSIFTFDDTRPPFTFGPAGTRFTNFHMSPTVPASNTAPYPELSGTLPRSELTSGGVVFCMVDIQPGAIEPMHRTLSVDYAVVLSGEIVLAVDTGAEKTVKAGEIMVQRGANHAWHNRTKEVCRILAVMVSTEKIVLADGKVLEETAFGKKP